MLQSFAFQYFQCLRVPALARFIKTKRSLAAINPRTLCYGGGGWWYEGDEVDVVDGMMLTRMVMRWCGGRGDVVAGGCGGGQCVPERLKKKERGDEDEDEARFKL
ncbi:hypothetical protein Tco_0497023 [Tanacetum coccineum]